MEADLDPDRKRFFRDPYDRVLLLLLVAPCCALPPPDDPVGAEVRTVVEPGTPLANDVMRPAVPALLGRSEDVPAPPGPIQPAEVPDDDADVYRGKSAG